jgi:hypothetical protein
MDGKYVVERRVRDVCEQSRGRDAEQQYDVRVRRLALLARSGHQLEVEGKQDMRCSALQATAYFPVCGASAHVVIAITNWPAADHPYRYRGARRGHPPGVTIHLNTKIAA